MTTPRTVTVPAAIQSYSDRTRVWSTQWNTEGQFSAIHDPSGEVVAIVLGGGQARAGIVREALANSEAS